MAVALIEAAERDGRAAARRHDRRADVGQHRHRPGDRRAPQGLPRDRGDARQDVARRRSTCCAPTAPRSWSRRPPWRPTRRESYYRVADRLTEEIPGAFQPNQYFNPANPQAHYDVDRPGAVGADRRADHAPRRRRRHRRHDHRHGPLPEGAQPGRSQVIGADPVGSIYSSGEERQAVPRRGRRRGLLAADVRPVGRRPLRDGVRPGRVPRPRAGWPMTEGILAGGSCGSALHAALEVAARDRRPRGDGRRDPPRRRAPLPVEDLQRRLDDASTASSSAPATQTVGDVLRAQAARPARSRRSSPCRPHQTRPRRDRAAARAPRLAAAGRQRARPATRRRLDRRARAAASTPSTTRALLDAEIVDVMEAPFPAVVRRRPGARGGRAAGRRPPGADRHRARAAPIGIVTRADLLEALARERPRAAGDALRDPRGARGPEPGPGASAR